MLKTMQQDNTQDHSYMQPLDHQIRHDADILHHSINLWRSAERLKQKIGKHFNYRMFPFVSQSVSLQKSVYNHCEEACNEENTRTPINSLDELAHLFGMQIKAVQRDGNCFFTSVALQIEKMSIEGTLVEPIRNHFSHLGIRSSLGIDGIAATLRQLLVNQWLGPDMDYYVNFFGNAGFNFRQEAIRFLDPNVFASPLGDAMPLGIANILRLPIMILSQQNLSPFIEISPRELYRVLRVSS